MEFHQRDIVLVNFPFTDLTKTKLRPALILSEDRVNTSNDLVFVQITSRPIFDKLYFPLDNDMLEGSLPLISGIRLHKIFCLNNRLVVHKLATLTPEVFKAVLDSIVNKVFGVKS